MEFLGFSTMSVVILTVLLVTLLLACVGLGVMSPQSGRRKAFFAAAGFLSLLLGGGTWFLATKEAPPAMMPAAEQKAPEKKEPEPPGSVVLVVDEATIPREDTPEQLDIERSKSRIDSQEKRREFRQLGRQLRYIEQSLNSQINPLNAEMQNVEKRFQTQTISNYEALYKKSQLKARQAEMVAAAMEEKLRLLEGASYLTLDDIGADIERVRKRRDEAKKKQEEYQAVLQELTANADVFRDL